MTKGRLEVEQTKFKNELDCVKRDIKDELWQTMYSHGDETKLVLLSSIKTNEDILDFLNDIQSEVERYINSEKVLYGILKNEAQDGDNNE